MFSLALGAAALTVSMPAGAAVIYHNSSAQFDAAVSNLQMEDFSDTTLHPDLSIAGNAIRIANGVLQQQTGPNRFTRFIFDGSVFGFGGDFDLTPDGVEGGLSIEVIFADNSNALLDPVTVASGFYGFTSDKAIKSVTIGMRDATSENFALDNVRFGGAAAVPEPASWAMMIAGFGLIGGNMRRQTRKLLDKRSSVPALQD